MVLFKKKALVVVSIKELEGRREEAPFAGTHDISSGETEPLNSLESEPNTYMAKRKDSSECTGFKSYESFKIIEENTMNVGRQTRTLKW